MQALRGPWPSWMIETGQEVKKYFTSDYVIHEELIPEKSKNFFTPEILSLHPKEKIIKKYQEKIEI